MLLAAELRFRVREGERPSPEEYRCRFPDRRDLVEAVFIAAIGPERIGAFMVVRLLGEGNFGRVYLCRDEQLDRMVAIKVPRADRFDGPQDLDRFLHEARLAARVKHPGIVAVHQVDRDKARRLLPRSRVHRGPARCRRCCTPNGSLRSVRPSC